MMTQTQNDRKFCANPVCRFHVDCKLTEQHIRIAVDVNAANQIDYIESRRKLVSTPDRRYFWLCETCANVLEVLR